MTTDRTSNTPAESVAPQQTAAVGPITGDDSFTRSAGKQLLIMALMTVMALVALMYMLNALATLVSSGSGSHAAVDIGTGTVTISIREEPPQLDSTLATDQVSGMIIGHVMEGLLRYDANNRLEAAIAERWEINQQGATFWLREDARWSDGLPVTAADFVFAWKTALDPNKASEYAFILFPIKNAEAINQGKASSDVLGATAVSDRVLKVVFEKPVAFFDKLVAFPTYYPIRESFYRDSQGRYGSDAEDLLYSGPFKITSWVHGASLMLEKNENYWDADRIKLNRINIGHITSDGNALLNFFKDDKIAYTSLQAENLGSAMEQRWNIERFQDGSVFFLEFNHRAQRTTRNLNLRRAMQYAIDPAELVYKVIKLPGYLPAESLFPVWLRGNKGLFRQEYPAPTVTINLQTARDYLEKAKTELGVTKLPPLVMLTGDNPVSNIQAEYFQAVLKRKLGLDIKIDKQIFKQRLAKMTSGEFDMVLAGWGPDYNDPLTFADLFASWNLNNRGRYSNPELDAQVGVAQISLDQRERMEAFARIQEILYEDAVVVYNYERGITYVTHPQVKGMVRRVVGADPDFTNAYLVAED